MDYINREIWKTPGVVQLVLPDFIAELNKLERVDVKYLPCMKRAVGNVFGSDFEKARIRVHGSKGLGVIEMAGNYRDFYFKNRPVLKRLDEIAKSYGFVMYAGKFSEEKYFKGKYWDRFRSV